MAAPFAAELPRAVGTGRGTDGVSIARRADVEVRSILASTGLTPPARVLDAGCGSGRHSVAFAALGFDVVGVDVDDEALAEARECAGSEATRLELRHVDMRELAFRSEFDLVVSLHTAFGSDGSDREHAAVVAGFARALRPGGHVILETINRDGQLPILPGTSWELGDDGTLSLDRYHFEPLTGTLVVMRTLFAAGRSHERKTWRIRLFASEELARMFGEQGLVDVAVTAGFASHDEPPLTELRAYTPSSPRILVRGRKPPEPDG